MSLRSPADLQAFVLADPLCRELAELAGEHGRAIALVGGWVRDWLLGRPALDWDLVIEGDPVPVVEAYARRIKGPVVVLDAEMGVVRTRLKGGLVLDFTRREGESFEADLTRRDLTINALAVDLASGALIDPTGGREDLEAGLVRAVSRKNLEDDPLRQLRVYRFAATLGYGVAPETTAWIRVLAPRIREAAGERVLAEFGKLLASPRAVDAIEDAVDTGLIAALFPEGDAAGGLPAVRAIAAAIAAWSAEDDPGIRRTMAVLDTAIAGDRPLRGLILLGALLAPLADYEAAADRLRWSNKEDAWLRPMATSPAAAIAAHEAPEPARALYRLIRAHGEATLGLMLSARSHGLSEADARTLNALYWDIADRLAAVPRPLTGHDLMRELNLPPGPHLGRLLERLDEARALGEIATREEALACAALLVQAGE